MRPYTKPQGRLKLAPDEITVSEAAKIAEIDDSTLYRYIKRGWIPSSRKGHTVVLKKTVPMKVKIAIMTPATLPWHQLIKWEAADLFEYKAESVKAPLHLTQSPQNEDFNVVSYSKSETKVSKTLGAIAKQLEQLGELSLAYQVSARAIELM